MIFTIQSGTSILIWSHIPGNTQRNKHIIVTSKWRFDVIIMCLLRCVFDWKIHPIARPWGQDSEYLGQKNDRNITDRVVLVQKRISDPIPVTSLHCVSATFVKTFTESRVGVWLRKRSPARGGWIILMTVRRRYKHIEHSLPCPIIPSVLLFFCCHNDVIDLWMMCNSSTKRHRVVNYPLFDRKFRHCRWGPLKLTRKGTWIWFALKLWSIKSKCNTLILIHQAFIISISAKPHWWSKKYRVVLGHLQAQWGHI